MEKLNQREAASKAIAEENIGKRRAVAEMKREMLQKRSKSICRHVRYCKSC